MRAAVPGALLVSVLLISSQVMAKAEFTLSVPNTSANGGCMTCHTSISAPVEWNDFGLDVQETAVDGQPSWAALCDLDSDGDGATNGLELADPECSWVAGDDDPAGDVTHPGDAESTPLGTDEPVEPDTVDSPDAFGDDPYVSGDNAPLTSGSMDNVAESSSESGDMVYRGGCQGGSSAPLAALGMLFALAMVLRRRFV